MLEAKPQVLTFQCYYVCVFVEEVFTKLRRAQNNYGAHRQKRKAAGKEIHILLHKKNNNNHLETQHRNEF